MTSLPPEAEYPLELFQSKRLQRLSLLFLSVTCFSDFSDKIKYA